MLLFSIDVLVCFGHYFILNGICSLIIMEYEKYNSAKADAVNYNYYIHIWRLQKKKKENKSGVPYLLFFAPSITHPYAGLS